jgi:hypothetical protein
MDENPISDSEIFKAVIDYVKHITTLSTGSLLLLATFLEKIFVKPVWKPLIGVCFGFFVLSILGCVVMLTILIALRGPDGRAVMPAEDL